MSALAHSTERFAAGEPVLVGGEHDATIFVAAAAGAVTPAALERLHELGRGMVVLGLADEIADRLALPSPGAGVRPPIDVPFTAPIDAAFGVSGGWSLRDRAHTIRVAADARTRPDDLTIPGHVHAARVGPGDGGAAAAALELARLSGREPAVALCAVVDRSGASASLVDARQDPGLGRLPFAASAELRGLVRARRMRVRTISCALPLRGGAFVAEAYGSDGDVMVALVHGDPAARLRPLVHVHAACVLGDAFGSLACDCRAALDDAFAAIVEAGAGVVLYAKPTSSMPAICGREQGFDAAVAAGLLRQAGVTRLRLGRRDAALAGELRALGLDVALPASAPRPEPEPVA